MARGTRRRWRRPERMTIDQPLVARRKDIIVPTPLSLEPSPRRRHCRRRLQAMGATFVAVSAIEGLAIGIVVSRPVLAGLCAALGLVYVTIGSELADRMLRRSLLAEPAKNPRLNRMTTKLAGLADIKRPDVLVMRAQGMNALAIGFGHGAVVATTGSLNADDLVLEGMLAHEIVRIRDTDARLSSTYVVLGGVIDLLSRNLATLAGPLLGIGLLLLPAGLAVRVLRPLWIDADGDERADVAAALLTRYPPGVELALRAAGPPPPGPRAAAPLWFGNNAEQRAGVVGEM